MARWTYEWEKPCAPFYPAAFFTMFKEGDKFFNKPINVMITGVGHRASMYFDEDSLNIAAEHLMHRILHEHNFLEEYQKRTDELHKVMWATGRKAVKTRKPELFEQYFHDYWHASTAVATIRQFNRIGIKVCEEWLSTVYTDKEDVSEALSILAGSPKISFAQKEQTSFKNLLLYVLEHYRKEFLDGKEKDIDDDTLAKMMAKHLEEFGWFPCGYDNEAPWDSLYLIDELRRCVKDEDRVLARLRAAEDYPARLEEERKVVFAKLNPPKDMARMFEALSVFTFYKDRIRESLNQFHLETRPYLELISEAIGLKGYECTELLPWHVIELIKNKQKFTGEFVGRQTYALVYDDGYAELFGEEAQKIIDQVTHRDAFLDVIKGSSASPGKVKGYVKLVFRPRHYLGEKDIVLVAPMTNPDLVPAMRNAVAIVTDEGGITCHAAIVSRELGIPCITGTKIATKVLKDGDFVEVDADNGFIKILKK